MVWYICLLLMRNTNRLNDTPISIKTHFNDNYKVSNCRKDLFKENSEENFILMHMSLSHKIHRENLGT